MTEHQPSSTPPPETELPLIRVVAGVIAKDGRLLIARRAPHKHLAGRWEFPGGQIEPDEKPAEALARVLKEEFGIQVTVGRFIASRVHSDPAIRINLVAFDAEYVGGTLNLDSHDAVKWVAPTELCTYDITDAEAFIVRAVTAVPSFTFRPITREEQRIFRKRVSGSTLGWRLFAVAATTLLTYLAVMLPVAVLAAWDLLHIDPFRRNTLELSLLGGGVLLGLILQWLYGRSRVREATGGNVRPSRVKVETVACRRVIRITDINWDDRVGYSPGYLVEVADDCFLYLIGKYIDQAARRNHFPATSFEITRAEESNIGLNITSSNGQRPSVESREMWIDGTVADGALLPFPLDEINDRVDDYYLHWIGTR